MHFISNCSFFNNGSIALPGEHVHCFLEAVEHCKTLQLYLEDITIKRECVSKMFCVWSVIISFYVDSCLNRNFLVSDKVFCKVTKCTRTSSSHVVQISIVCYVTGSRTHVACSKNMCFVTILNIDSFSRWQGVMKRDQ